MMVMADTTIVMNKWRKDLTDPFLFSRASSLRREKDDALISL